MGIQISESQFSTVQDNRGALFHFFLSKTATIYLKKHPTNCSWWILSVELYQYRFSETCRQKDSSKSKSPARSRVWDREWKNPSKLVDFNIKSRQKKRFEVQESNLTNLQTFQNSESRNLLVYSIRLDSKSCRFWPADRIELNLFFCLDFITKMTGFRRIFDLTAQERYLARLLLLDIVTSSRSRFLISVSKTISLRRHSGACCLPPNRFVSCFWSFLNRICDVWCSKWSYWSDFAWFRPKLWTPYSVDLSYNSIESRSNSILSGTTQ